MHTQKRGNTQNSRTNKTSKKAFLCSVFTLKKLNFSYYSMFRIAHCFQSSLFAIPPMFYVNIFVFLFIHCFLGGFMLSPILIFSAKFLNEKLFIAQIEQKNDVTNCLNFSVPWCQELNGRFLSVGIVLLYIKINFRETFYFLFICPKFMCYGYFSF